MIWALLLRGVNVSGANRLPMAAFRALLADLGGEGPETYIQSGNAVFAAEGPAAALAEKIASGIAARFGFRPALWLLPAADFAKISAANPYARPGAEPKTVHIYYLSPAGQAAAAKGLEAALAFAAPGEAVTLGEGALYLQAPHGMGRSVLAEKLARLLKDGFTARNLATVAALGALLDARAAGGRAA